MKRALISLLAAVLCTFPSFADDRPGDAEGGPPPMILAFLEGAGIATDDASLMVAAESHADEPVRWAATSVLAEREVIEARDLFRRLAAGDEAQSVREAAAYGLARLGEESGVAVLEAQLAAASDRMERISVAQRLAEVGRGTGYPDVVEALSVDSGAAGEASEDNSRAPEAVRVAAVNSLQAYFEAGVVGDEVAPQPRELLLQAAADPAELVRSAAITQLSVAVYQGHLELAAVRPAIERLASGDPEPAIRQQAEGLLTAWRFEAEEATRRGASSPEGGR